VDFGQVEPMPKTFTTRAPVSRLCQMNLKRNVAVLSAAVGLALSGCSTTISNLTPSRQVRNANNIYPFEVQFQTAQKSIKQNTIKPYVIIGTETYPMQPTPMLKGRWEAQVPVAATNNFVHYRYKFDYEYDRIPTAGQSSRLSPTYQMQFSDR
jgi:hypothetical protein